MDIETRRMELLAPAGRKEVVRAVLDAGADAVYLGTKRFNMRMHRGDFHFDQKDLAWALDHAHQRGAAVYVTVNNLIGQSEIDEVARLLERLEAMGADAIIVQDLGVMLLAHQMGLGVPRHASTQMNVHSAETARALKRYGITRVITSRDISLEQASRIRREAAIEIEYFVHGDMCVCQGGQCYTSGLSMHKSSNRGECMKPCRWQYELVEAHTGRPLRREADGYFLAVKDLSLLRHIPDLVQAGVDCLKIEGRMRDAGYLHAVVAMYREAIDGYYASPMDWYVHSPMLERKFKQRVRDQTTMVALGPSRGDLLDPSGQREPLLLSKGKVEARLEPAVIPEPPINGCAPAPMPALVVTVGDLRGVGEALEAGVDRVDLVWERAQRREGTWGIDSIRRAIELARQAGVGVGLKTPRVTTERETAELRWVLGQLAGSPPDWILVHTIGAVGLAGKFGFGVVADFGLNVLNGRSAAALADMGAARVTASIEASFEDLEAICRDSPVPVELIVHGPLEEMLIEHCAYALHLSATGTKESCRAPCQHIQLALRDAAGESRRVMTDQYCRNHILSGADLSLAGHLGRVLRCGVGAVRVEAQYYPADRIGPIVGLYRDKLGAWARSDADGCRLSPGDWEVIKAVSPNGVGLLALGGQVTRSVHTAQTIKTNLGLTATEVSS